VDTNEVNPYEPPKTDERPPVCNFCGKSPGDGSLVRAPKEDVYICASCARDVSYTVEADEIIESGETHSLPFFFSVCAGVVLLGAALALLIFLANRTR